MKMNSEDSTKQVSENRRPLPHKINNQWTINLDLFFDINALDAMYFDLVKGIVRSKKHWEPVIIGSKYALYNREMPEVTVYQNGILKESGILDRLVEEGFSNDDIYEFTKFAYPTIGLGKKLLLRTYKDYVNMYGAKHLASKNFDTEAYQYFPQLKEFIEQSGAFSEVGRVMFFLTERRTCTETHCDYGDLKSRKDQFIIILPKKIKKLFVLDENFEKHYTTGVINTFDNGTWHGSEPVETSTFSIRVDGKFSTEFLKKTGLENHYTNKD